jgi:hypothetical protein
VFASERHIRTVAGADLRGMHARVLRRTADGRPARVRFEFDGALDAPARRFVIWSGARPLPWTPPPVGGVVRVPALNLLRALGG